MVSGSHFTTKWNTGFARQLLNDKATETVASPRVEAVGVSWRGIIVSVIDFSSDRRNRWILSGCPVGCKHGLTEHMASLVKKADRCFVRNLNEVLKF
jgi:hypothetical protein